MTLVAAGSACLVEASWLACHQTLNRLLGLLHFFLLHFQDSAYWAPLLMLTPHLLWHKKELMPE